MIYQREIAFPVPLRIFLHRPVRHDIDRVGDRLTVGCPHAFDAHDIRSGIEVETLDIVGKHFLRRDFHERCAGNEMQRFYECGYAPGNREVQGYRWSAVLDECPEAVFTVDDSFRFQFLERLSERGAGYPELFRENRFGREPVTFGIAAVIAEYHFTQTVNRGCMERFVHGGIVMPFGVCLYAVI